MLRTRNRIINFRVTEDEFTRLRDASVRNGARCLSDFARAAILIGLEGYQSQSAGEGGRVDQMQSLVRRIGVLERNIAKLERTVSVRKSNEKQEVSLGAAV